MRITNQNDTIGFEGENNSRTLEFEIDEKFKDCIITIEFTKPDGTKSATKKVDVDKGYYLLPISLLFDSGFLEVQLVAYKDGNFIGKSETKTFYISKSVNAVEQIIKNEPNLIGELLDELSSKADNISVNQAIIQLLANGKPIGNQIVVDRAISIELDQSTGVLKLLGYDKNGEYVVLKEVDFAVEKILTNVYLDTNTNELVMEFINSQTVRIQLGDIFTLENYYTKEQSGNIFQKKLTEGEGISISEDGVISISYPNGDEVAY